MSILVTSLVHTHTQFDQLVVVFDFVDHHCHPSPFLVVGFRCGYLVAVAVGQLLDLCQLYKVQHLCFDRFYCLLNLFSCVFLRKDRTDADGQDTGAVVDAEMHEDVEGQMADDSNDEVNKLIAKAMEGNWITY